MAEAQQTGMTAAQLQEMLQAVIKAAKEPTTVQQEELEKKKALQVRWAKEQAEIAKNEEKGKWNRWMGCKHATHYNGRVFVAWCGQVNSDNMVRPVCNLCHVEAPPFSARLLPDGGKMGVNFHEWIDASREVLTGLHKQTFPDGCERATCFVCHPNHPKK